MMTQNDGLLRLALLDVLTTSNQVNRIGTIVEVGNPIKTTKKRWDM